MLQPIGDLQTLAGWQNLKAATDAKTTATVPVAELALPGEAIYRYPQGPIGWSFRGFRQEHDGTNDWRSYYGLQFDVELLANQAVEFKITLFTPPTDFKQEFVAQTSASVSLQGAGWHRVTLPWSAFDFKPCQPGFLKFIQQLHIAGRFADGSTGSVRLKNIRLIRAPSLFMDCPVRGQSAPVEWHRAICGNRGQLHG